jgi:DNA-binding transcriptional ArsR family regulator
MTPLDDSDVSDRVGLSTQEIREYIERSLDDIIVMLSALSNPVRLKVMLHLLDGSCSFNDLKDLTGLKKSALSTHLNQLKEMDLITSSGHGIYEITEEGRNRLVALAIMFRSPQDLEVMKQRADATRSFLERKKE